MDLHETLIWIAKASYFLAAVLFILGIKRMASPVTARKGIVQAGIGMVIATLATFAITGMHNIGLIIGRSRIGVIPTWFWGKKVAMTDMPQMVALFNGMGGGSAAAIGAGELIKASEGGVGRRQTAGHGGVGRARRADRRGVDDRLDHRLGQARRAHGQALHLPRPAVFNFLDRFMRRGGAGHRDDGLMQVDTRLIIVRSSCWRCCLAC
jgi:hypothetical protein